MAVSSVLVSSTAPPARAAVTEVTNLTNSNDVGSTLNFTTSVRAGAFTTGATAVSWTLDSITARIAGSPVNGDGTVTMSLYTDNFGQPGALIETLGGTYTPQGISNHAFPSAGTTLSPNTTYWAVLTRPTGTTLVEWNGTADFSETSPDGWTINNQFDFSEDGGASWGGNGNFSEIMAVAVVPEPGTIAMLLAMPVAAAISRRRRNV
jgi:hypothetical protein